MTLASSIMSSINSIEFGKNYNFACEFANSLETGLAMIMYFQLNFLVAWQLYAVTTDLYEFAANKHLPSERIKRRNKRIYLGIWGLSIVMWISYSVGAYYMSNLPDNTLLWETNFIFHCVLAAFVIVFTALFYLSYRRIKHITKILKHQANDRVLRFAKRTTLSFVICLTSITVFECIGLITQGSFGPIAIVSNALTSIDYVVLEALYFIALTTVNLDFTLTTQVLADGNVLIVCVDDRGNAI